MKDRSQESGVCLIKHTHDPEPMDPVRAAHTVKLSESLVEVIKKARADVDMSALKEAIEARDRKRIEKILDFPKLWATSYGGIVVKAIKGAADEALPEKIAVAAAEVGATEKHARRASSDPAYISKWAKDRVKSELLRTTKDGMQMIREALDFAFDSGEDVDPEEFAEALVGKIGLTNRQAVSLEKYKDDLKFEGDYTAKEIRALAAQRSHELLTRRATLIASNEIQRAMSASQVRAWGSLVDDGSVDDRWEKEWQVTSGERACEICVPLDEKRVGMDEEFAEGIEMPPDPHIGCECRVVLRRVEREDEEEELGAPVGHEFYGNQWSEGKGGSSDGKFSVRDRKAGDGVAHKIVVDKKPVGHLSGFAEDRHGIPLQKWADPSVQPVSFHLYRTELSDEKFKGTGVFRAAAQTVANKYATGMYVYEWEASPALQKSLAKIKTYEFEKETKRIWIRPDLATHGAPVGHEFYGNQHTGSNGGSNDSPTVAKAVQDLSAHATSGSKKERLIAIAGDGTIIQDTMESDPVEGQPFGAQGVMSSADEQRRWINQPDQSITDMHTHPDPTGPSDGDWKRFSWPQVKEMRIFTASGGTHIIQKTDEWTKSDFKTRTPAVINQRWGEILDEETGLDKVWTPESVTVLVSQRLAKELGVIYKYIPPNEKHSAPVGHPFYGNQHQGGSGSVELRPSGWRSTSDDAVGFLSKIKKADHFYRGMTADEFDATIGAGKPVQSTGKFSHRSEGTNFSDDPADAESYVNFGRDDPRTTGKPTYLVEAAKSDSMYRDTDGYMKDKSPVAPTRVWMMDAKGGAIVATPIEIKREAHGAPAGHEFYGNQHTGSTGSDEKIPPGDPRRDVNFKAWFGGSKITGPDGTPLQLYHGTTKDVGNNLTGEFSQKDSGIYLTPDPEYASGYASNFATRMGGRFPDGGKILPVFAKIEKPAFALVKPEPFDEKAIAALKAKGHDGLIVGMTDYEFEIGDPITKNVHEIVVFDSRQLKATKGNNGTFSPDDDDIRHRARIQKESQVQPLKVNGQGYSAVKIRVNGRAGWAIAGADSQYLALPSSGTGKLTVYNTKHWSKDPLQGLVERDGVLEVLGAPVGHEFYGNQHTDSSGGVGPRDRWLDATGRFDADSIGRTLPRAGDTVEGLEVKSDVPNTDSISAGLSDYDELPGIRAVPVSDFVSLAPRDMYAASDDLAKVKNLSEQIKASGWIKPLIVVYDVKGPYILEGGHRAAALASLGAKTIPALVVVDYDEDQYEEKHGAPAGHPFYGNQHQDGSGSDTPLKLTGKMKDGAAEGKSSRVREKDALDELVGKGYRNPLNPREIVLSDEAAIEISPAMAFDDGPALHIAAIRSFSPGTGAGSRALKTITDVADKYGITLDLEARGFGGGKMDDIELIKWYKRHGFVDDTRTLDGDSPKDYGFEDGAYGLLMRHPSGKGEKHGAPVGHEFYGNQHTGSQGGSSEERYAPGDPRREEKFQSWFKGSKVVDDEGKPKVVYHGTGDSFTKFDIDESVSEVAFFMTDDKESAEEYGYRSNKEYRDTVKELDASLAELAKEWDANGLVMTMEDPGSTYYFGNLTRQIDNFVRDGGDKEKALALNKLADRTDSLAIKVLDFDHKRWDNEANVMPVFASLKNPKIVDGTHLPYWQMLRQASFDAAIKGGHDGIIFKNVIDNASSSERRANVYVAFKPNQIKSAIGNKGTFDPKDDDIRHSLGEGKEMKTDFSSEAIELLIADAEAVLKHGAPAGHEFYGNQHTGGGGGGASDKKSDGSVDMGKVPDRSGKIDIPSGPKHDRGVMDRGGKVRTKEDYDAEDGGPAVASTIPSKKGPEVGDGIPDMDGVDPKSLKEMPRDGVRKDDRPTRVHTPERRKEVEGHLASAKVKKDGDKYELYAVETSKPSNYLKVKQDVDLYPSVKAAGAAAKANSKGLKDDDLWIKPVKLGVDAISSNSGNVFKARVTSLSSQAKPYSEAKPSMKNWLFGRHSWVGDIETLGFLNTAGVDITLSQDESRRWVLVDNRTEDRRVHSFGTFAEALTLGDAMVKEEVEAWTE